MSTDLVGRGERALMAAVLADAIRCLKGEIGPDDERPILVAEARAWIEDDDTRWPFSFENICLTLGIDAATLRRRVLAYRVEIAAPPRPRARRPVSTPAKASAVTDMILAGHPLRDVARVLGISTTRASTLSQNLASRLKVGRNADIRRLRAEGWTCGALAGHFGLSRMRVYRICSDPPPARATPPGDATPGMGVSC